MTEGPYYYVISPCYSCGAPFSYNPHLVPSIPIDESGHVSPTGDRKPICRTCITFVNERRKLAGLPLWTVNDAAYEPVEGLL